MVLVSSKYEEVEKYAPLCVALGSFDGVHVGHQKLIDVLRQNSIEFSAGGMVYTFSSHPRKTLMPDQPMYLLTNNEKRSDILEKFGVDILFLEDFSQIMKMDAKSFILDILINKFKVKCVVVGYNYHFGYNGEGTADTLVEYGKKYGFKVEIIPAVEVDGETVSSSLIRRTIRSGDVDKVPLYLGRAYSLLGNVSYGKQNGRTMGIRTANLEPETNAMLPLRGVYITDTLVGGKLYKSVTNVGQNPTFGGDKLTIETHMLDFDGDIYDEQIEVFFLKRLRDEMMFPSPAALVDQIKSDIAARISYNSFKRV